MICSFTNTNDYSSDIRCKHTHVRKLEPMRAPLHTHTHTNTQHGPNECLVDELEGCAFAQQPDPVNYMPFVYCFEVSRASTHMLEHC